jgi:hypothetical protein
VVGALGAVVAVALVIGVVIGAVAYGAARLVGLTDSPDSSAAGPPSPAQSDDHESSSPSASPSPQHRPHVERARDKSTHPHRRHRRRHRHTHGLTLVATPHDVHRMGRVHLAGSYPGHAGSRLVLQRFEAGHWDRFPVTVVVRGGHFRTWVASGYPGKNRFRVVDPAAGTASRPVTFVVH